MIMNKRTILQLTAAATTTLADANQSDFPLAGRPPSSRQYTVVLCGQSNMVGRGGLQLPPDSGGVFYNGSAAAGEGEEITGNWNWTWNNASEGYAEELNLTGSAGSMDGRIQTLAADLQWKDAQARLHEGMVAKIAGIGPGLIFARDFLQRLDDSHDGGDGSTVNLIPTAKGSASLEDWWPGNNDTGFYANMINRIHASNVTKIDAFIWYQGESDSKTNETADSYAERLQQWIGLLRSDLNFTEPLWMVLVKPIGDPNHYAFIDTVREQVEAAAANTSFSALVDAPINASESGFDVDTPDTPPGLRLDHVHLNLRAQEIMGKTISNVVVDLPGIREPGPSPTMAPSGAGPSGSSKPKGSKSRKASKDSKTSKSSKSSKSTEASQNSETGANLGVPNYFNR